MWKAILADCCVDVWIMYHFHRGAGFTNTLSPPRDALSPPSFSSPAERPVHGRIWKQLSLFEVLQRPKRNLWISSVCWKLSSQSKLRIFRSTCSYSQNCLWLRIAEKKKSRKYLAVNSKWKLYLSEKKLWNSRHPFLPRPQICLWWRTVETFSTTDKSCVSDSNAGQMKSQLFATDILDDKCFLLWGGRPQRRNCLAWLEPVDCRVCGAECFAEPWSRTDFARGKSIPTQEARSFVAARTKLFVSSSFRFGKDIRDIPGISHREDVVKVAWREIPWILLACVPLGYSFSFRAKYTEVVCV